MVKNDVNTYLKTVERKEEITISFTQSMLCSMVAGALAAVITNPLDLAKLRMQISRAGVKEKGFSDYKHMFDAVSSIFSREGF